MLFPVAHLFLGLADRGSPRVLGWIDRPAGRAPGAGLFNDKCAMHDTEASGRFRQKERAGSPLAPEASGFERLSVFGIMSGDIIESHLAIFTNRASLVNVLVPAICDSNRSDCRDGFHQIV
jgi:hypothetical protein